ncbi:unnamed protein product [Miscanthus lutarioriparius]|uniref:X8 domain-containing protein n=1 Tax=Miscanthus lutarioriparius TaxID=422564 RepID=A0A811NL72_9POAL|nr:unnamed protein product [Miscanthus lutarioriparius]
MKALVVTVLLLLSSTLAASQWCVCRQDATQAALQKTIDYACGSGADCNSIHENGRATTPTPSRRTAPGRPTATTRTTRPRAPPATSPAPPPSPPATQVMPPQA